MPVDEKEPDVLGAVWDAAVAQCVDPVDVMVAQVFLHEEPKLAALQGVDTLLIAVGEHVPSGSTTVADMSAPIFDASRPRGMAPI